MCGKELEALSAQVVPGRSLHKVSASSSLSLRVPAAWQKTRTTLHPLHLGVGGLNHWSSPLVPGWVPGLLIL